MTQKEKRHKYPTDLTDAQWKIISSLIPPPKPGGRPRTTDVREVINGILYLLKSGCQWRLLPGDFPNWPIVYYYFKTWKKDGTWKKIHDAVRGKLRRSAGKKTQPTAGIIDSQSSKTTEKGGFAAMMPVKK
jgi:putative transposase